MPTERPTATAFGSASGSGGAATERGRAARERVLRAARAEFAEHGIAGARVERVLTAARTSKAQLYDYFGSKERLFDAVFEGSLDELLAAAPDGPDDLAAWAVRLYDQCLRHPELVRLASWYRLERRPAGQLVDDSDRLDPEGRRRIAESQGAGRLVQGDPFDVMALVIGMAMAWSPVSTVYAATTDETDAVHEARRDLLRRAVRAAVAGG